MIELNLKLGLESKTLAPCTEDGGILLETEYVLRFQSCRFLHKFQPQATMYIPIE